MRTWQSLFIDPGQHGAFPATAAMLWDETLGLFMPTRSSLGAAHNRGSMGGLWKTGVLQNTTAFILDMKGAPLPALVWARPNAGDTVLVEYSTDNGANFSNTLIGSTTVYSETTLTAGITQLRFTLTVQATNNSSWGVC
jgi:hypothetical protein